MATFPADIPDHSSFEETLALDDHKEMLIKANLVADKHGLFWESTNAAASFYDLVKQGCTVKEALFTVELATGQKPTEDWYIQSWQHANNTASWGQSKEPKKKLPYYQGKRRF